MKRPIVSILFCLLSLWSYGQTILKGKIVDSKTSEPLVGAPVVIKGSLKGATAGLDGDFTLKTDETGEKKLTIASVGYIAKEVDIKITGEVVDLGTIGLEIASVGLNEVSIIASVAIDRKTPVAVSTIKQSYIEDKLGNNEFPEILQQTPGIYATKQGGAFGDSRVNIRGFDSRNVGVLINGVPVNDMENGTVYWSNWAGLADVTRSMQVQRGLGAAKIALPSVGGTVNVLTNTTDAAAGGKIFYTVGNDNMNKVGASLSTGLTQNNWAATVSVSKNTGNGFAQATQYEAYSYFLNLSKKINNKHTLAFTIFGAPQWHNQRSYQIAYSSFEKYGIRYNDQWGYKDGQVFNVKKNYYHKPQAILNHFWNIDENTRVSTALYASTGTGGGTGASSTITARTNDGLLDLNKVVATNIANGTLGSSTIIKDSRNDHVWLGAISTISKTFDHLTVSLGLDARTYRGSHYQLVSDLLGGQFYVDKNTNSSGDVNAPNKVSYVGDKVGYHNDGLVNWYGAFAQAEYSINKLTVTVAGSLSDKWYRRVDYNRYFSDDIKSALTADSACNAQYTSLIGADVYKQAAAHGQTSQITEILGYCAKGGANYNITDHQNVFFNIGYFERQPDFNTVYPNNLNDKNKNAKNEKVFSAELGYGFRSSHFSGNLNVYNTEWDNKTIVMSQSKNGVYYNANIAGANSLYQGVEFDFVASPVAKLKINGVFNLQNNLWKKDLDSIYIYDDNHVALNSKATNLKLKDVHVGNAAQTVIGIGADYELLKGVYLGANYTYFDRLYANFDVTQKKTVGDVWKMPAYGILSMNFKYNFVMGNLNSTFYANVNNLLNTKYFSDGTDTDVSKPANMLAAQVFYGLGTTWSMGLRVKF